ncbi:MAG: hypothetical protein JSU59_06530 [Nitrospirota bacterium]|nr:MAG: hypothetical protein JSU59_06530 [Nitrospirota bacterium]
MAEQSEKSNQGKRVGVHPIIVIFGVIIGLWLFITMIIPKSKDDKLRPGKPAQSVGSMRLSTISSDLVPSFKTKATIPDMNAITLLVPPDTTDSQVMALINHLRIARADGTLSKIVPPTTAEDELGDFAIADFYIFSDPEYAVPDAAKALSRGAHAPGEFYPTSIPFEEAMEHVRGHYAINLHNRTTPETASLGFGEPTTGVYSKHYQALEF